jgi:hypothetical protein
MAVLCSACSPEVTVTATEYVGTDGSTGASSSGSSSTSSSSSGGQKECFLNDLSSWEIESSRDDGDYPRGVAATSGTSWVALAVTNGNLVIERLGIDDQAGIAILEKFEVPNSPVYPLAFDVNDARFVLLTTTGINWNGTLELWLIERASGEVLRMPVGDPDDPNYTIRAALALVGDDIAMAYARPANNEGVIEIRNGSLDVVTSQPVNTSQFQGVWRSPLALDIYLGANSLAHVESGAITIEPVSPEWQVIGGLEDILVEMDAQFRMTRGDDVWLGPWPHTQISTPAVVRKQGEMAVFSLNTELTGVIGYPHDGALDWMHIESMPGAWGAGVGLMPLIEERRVGIFYMGIEIPKPEQPLRYFGRVCR